MWFLRLLRHPAMIVCVIGHAVLVSVWLVRWWTAYPWDVNDPRVLLLGPLALFDPIVLLYLLDFPIILLAYRFPGVVSVGAQTISYPLAFALHLLAAGTLQWGLIGVLLAVPDLLNQPKR